MGKVSHARSARRLSSSTFASLTIASCALAGSTVASAAEAAAPSDSGLMKFTNVVVINAPAAASSTNDVQAGMRVYKDSATGQMRGPTSDEMQSDAKAMKNSAATRSAVARESSSAESSSPAMTSYASNGGGVAQTLDESFLQYSVVVRQPDGSLAEVCVTGSEKADEVNRVQPVLKQTKEVAHDR